MAIKKLRKRGDTLIEVMLAVGIFSMVAVSIVSVMSGGTSSSQTALETTLARQEIDNQAEILRFLQQAYTADNKASINSAYSYLWKGITEQAYNKNDAGNLKADIAQYHPNDCGSLYKDDGEATIHGFVIDPTAFTNYVDKFDSTTDPNVRKAARQEILFTNKNGAKNLAEATTYPHIIYNTGQANDTSTDLDRELLPDDNTAGNNNSFYQAQGIYIIAVRDPGNTNFANNGTSNSNAYYDFYIRTCWYGAGDTAPSTISTIIRLYNPDLTAPENTSTTP